jgi:SAM-dependent methyltransferase
MLLYALTILVSAFLLFQIEPIIAKAILPWFGGSANVWTTCLLFFQIVLLLGYLYAHAVVRYLRPKAQAMLHMGLLAASLLVLPVVPAAAWKPIGNEDPIFRILGLLAVTIGVPYFLLSSTGPLVQAWYARRFDGAIPYRLYALSNAGSMFALISYPVLVEPAFATRLQAMGWSVGYAAFIALCGITAYSVRNYSGQKAAAEAEIPAQAPDWKLHLWWILLPACASVLLLAITNFLSQDVAAIPFLWVLPLSLYLLSFILCFDKEGWYRRSTFLKFFAVALVATAYGIRGSEDGLSVKGAIPLFCANLFIFCMVCHGELVKLKPHPRYLTSFYLMISAGGALGGICVGLVALNLFPGFFEMQIGLAATAVLVALRFRQRTQQWAAVAVATLCFVAYLGIQIGQSDKGVRVMARNFYGGLKVVDQNEPPNAVRVEMHGTINHGQQYLDPQRRDWPISYYSRDSGVGIAIREAWDRGPNRVGVIGLGAGTLAAYGRPGDVYRFYEINPLVIQLARSQFTFLDDCKAHVEMVLGDGRLSLAREPNQQFDILVVDAFSGDSVPVHLLTREAFDLYFRHLRPAGVLVVHVTNKYLALAAVVHRIAGALGQQDRLVEDPGNRAAATFPSAWVLVSGRACVFDQPEIHRAAKRVEDRPRLRIWTDDYSNLFQILR